ncbi:MAG: NADH-quinone oxidoreductase subunit M [Planctomycetales bacterium]|nr:NADH-quinone oxidoreductase subunit M [bacterium]UNM09597.1 MAG: NADH-quinone oxidoreductase subunit M [Planctomycetales bacterium]
MDQTQSFIGFISWISNPITQMMLAPLVGCLLVCLIPKKKILPIKIVALVFSLLSLLFAVLLLTGMPEGATSWRPYAGYTDTSQNVQDLKPLGQYTPFQAEFPGFQYRQDIEWMAIKIGESRSFSVHYDVGIDGLSLPLVLMTCALLPLIIIWGWYRTERVKEFLALTLFMQVGLIGSFVALDFVLLYLFWEWMLIPMYVLIGGWGKDREKAARAAIRFFVYTMAGSVFMLMSLIICKVISAGVYSFQIPNLATFLLNEGYTDVVPWLRMWIFLGFLVAFAVKAPLFPLHTWLPPAHTQAPAEMSVILAAVMLKSGTYAFLRVLYWALPDQGYAIGPVVATLAVVGIVWGAAVTLVQTDIKRMIAYSSISHMGFIILGCSAMNPLATTGAIYHMVGHGVIITTLFLLADSIERRYGTRNVHEIAGLGSAAPLLAGMLSLAAFAGMGFPALAGFWGELYSLMGAFENGPGWQTVLVGSIDGSLLLQILAAVAVIGVLTSAVYMISLLQRTLPGDAPESAKGHVPLREAIVLLPLGVAIIFLGVYPNWLMHMSAGYSAMLDSIHSAGIY